MWTWKHFLEVAERWYPVVIVLWLVRHGERLDNMESAQKANEEALEKLRDELGR